MKLILTQAEIEVALTKHIFETIALRDGQTVSIDFSATRGEAGLTATVDIPYMGVTQLDISAQQQAPKEPVKRAAKVQRLDDKIQSTPEGNVTNALDIDKPSDAGSQTGSEDFLDQGNHEIVTDVFAATEAPKKSLFTTL